MTGKQFVNAYRKYGSIKAIARATGRTYYSVREAYVRALKEGHCDPIPVGRKRKGDHKAPEPKFSGKVGVRRELTFSTPDIGVVRYIFTSAQNNTVLHDQVWENLLALAAHYGAELHVGRFSYVKTGLGARGDKAKFVKRHEAIGMVQDLWWDERIKGHVLDERVHLAPGLMWCGEVNILPTAERPLSGFENYTARQSGIYPHPKIAMESIPSGKYEPTKFNYTTGAVTLRNYIQRKAGLKAEFHHVYGGLLVEVDSDGDWFVRQLNADQKGDIYDLDLKVSGGKVTTGHGLEAITWGDIHCHELDPVAADLAWGDGGILDTLKPKYQFFHDVLDFRSRSHHEIKDFHKMFVKHVLGHEDVRGELDQVARFLKATLRPWCQSVVVDSNHHNHLGRWLRDEDGRKDPVNAEFWLQVQSAVYGALRERGSVNYLKEGLAAVGFDLDSVRFLEEDESYVICQDRGGIETGIHGHNGPNGSQGSPLKFAKMGRRANIGHSHRAAILDGVYVAGVCCDLNPNWTKGPGAWSHSHILTYSNGKRAIITCWNGKWAAKDG